MRNALKTVAGRYEGKRPLEESKCRWEDNIKMDLKKTECEDWIHLSPYGPVELHGVSYLILNENLHQPAIS
jgi:hypothetical protein